MRPSLSRYPEFSPIFGCYDHSIEETILLLSRLGDVAGWSIPEPTLIKCPSCCDHDCKEEFFCMDCIREPIDIECPDSMDPVCCETPGAGGSCFGFNSRWGEPFLWLVLTKLLITRWTYKDGSCVPFIYGGCGGNGNRFASEWECRATCLDMWLLRWFKKYRTKQMIKRADY